MTAESVPGLRRAAVWFPDWSVTAAISSERLDPHLPVAVHDGQIIRSVGPTARAEGVRRGMRKRTAQGVCPELILVAEDEGRDTRFFEQAGTAVDSVVPEVEIARAGLLFFPSQGPMRFFGSAEAVAERVIGEVADRTGLDCQVGIAEGILAAILAAREQLIIPLGDSRAFLSEFPIATLQFAVFSSALNRQRVATLIDLLLRLGLHTLGSFANLASRDVASRFGTDALLLYRLARGQDAFTLSRSQPATEVAISMELDPPVDRIDAAAFVARRAAEAFHAELVSESMTCGRLRIEAHTIDGNERVRSWRHDGELDAAGITDRVRWQLEGWLQGRSGATPDSALQRLLLVAEEIVPAGAMQPELWASVSTDDQRAHRTLTRIQHLLGPESVVTPVLQGGRDPIERVRLVAWGDELTPLLSPLSPWPGRLPEPSPTLVFSPQMPIEVLDSQAHPVSVSGRLALSGSPARLRIVEFHGHRHAWIGPTDEPIVAWAGPWPVTYRWWEENRRRARFQLLLQSGSAVLAVVENGLWLLEARYD